MATKFNKIFLDQILSTDKTLVNEANENKGIIVIKDFPHKQLTTTILHYNRIDIDLTSYSLIENQYLKTYLKPRLNAVKDCRFFFNNKLNIYLDQSFENSSLGMFKKAMWAFEKLMIVHAEFNKLEKIILD